MFVAIKDWEKVVNLHRSEKVKLFHKYLSVFRFQHFCLKKKKKSKSYMAHCGYDFCKNGTNSAELYDEGPHPKQTPEPPSKLTNKRAYILG